MGTVFQERIRSFKFKLNTHDRPKLNAHDRSTPNPYVQQILALLFADIKRQSGPVAQPTQLRDIRTLNGQKKKKNKATDYIQRGQAE